MYAIRSYYASAILNDEGGFGADPSGDEPGKRAIIQYVLIFNDEDEQKKWHGWLKDLKEKP